LEGVQGDKSVANSLHPLLAKVLVQLGQQDSGLFKRMPTSTTIQLYPKIFPVTLPTKLSLNSTANFEIQKMIIAPPTIIETTLLRNHTIFHLIPPMPEMLFAAFLLIAEVIVGTIHYF